MGGPPNVFPSDPVTNASREPEKSCPSSIIWGRPNISRDKLKVKDWPGSLVKPGPGGPIGPAGPGSPELPKGPRLPLEW